MLGSEFPEAKYLCTERLESRTWRPSSRRVAGVAVRDVHQGKPVRECVLRGATADTAHARKIPGKIKFDSKGKSLARLLCCVARVHLAVIRYCTWCKSGAVTRCLRGWVVGGKETFEKQVLEKIFRMA
ncbi:hypothetical protein E2C01_060520 [Portunus trituberculatus]|uniref:Uncharacterized protein n=1 Tax=Portunus trituberculatus TaxID=210409 RepID=A0A5B7H5P3_PORTR|nr:hypothetical protein [Portunus trituberculatus]